MKKVLRIFLIALGVILLLLFSLPILFKSKIESVVKEKINQDIHANVDWSRFSVSFFRGFPDLSLNLHQVSVVGKAPFEGDTLTGLKRFEIRVNPFSALKKEILVKSILVDQPLVNGLVLEDGTANWDLSPDSDSDDVTGQGENEEEDPGGASMSLSLRKFSIRNARIYYTDKESGTEASMEGLDLDLSGDFSVDLTQMDLQIQIPKLNAKSGGIRYLKNATFGLDLSAQANLVENRYMLQRNEMRLNGLVLGAEGEVSLLDEGAMDLDLNIFSRETDFQALLSMVPAIYLTDFEDINTSGKLKLEGNIKGLMKDTLLPDVNLILEVSDGYFAYPDLPKDVSDVQILLALNYKGTDMDATTLDLERFHLLLGGNPIDMSLKMDHPISDMHVSGEARGLVDFASLKDVVPLEEVSFEGRLETDLSWDTRMSYITEEQFDRVNLEGSLLIEQMQIETADLPVPLELSKMQMEFNPRFVRLHTLDLNLGSSDLHMDGDLANFIPYLFDDQTVSGSLNVSSKLVDANELMPEKAPEMNADSSLSVPPDSLAQPMQFRIPENVNFEMSLQMQKVLYDQIEVENIRGKMKLNEGIAYLEKFSMNVIEGEASSSGQVDTRGEFAEVDVAVVLKEIDIPSAYSQFVSVERLAPMAKYCQGTANMSLQFQSLLDATFTPLYESMNANGLMYTKGLKIYDLNSFVKLSDVLKNDKFKDIAPDEVEVSFKVRDGRVMIAPFDMAFESSNINMSGSHGIDMTLDYLLDMNIAKSDLGKGANELMNGMALLAAGAGLNIPQSDYVKVKAKITGTFNEPRVATDLSANLKSARETVQEAVEQKVMEEVEKVEEQVREEAGEQAEQIISQAEAEAERLIEEARKVGEELVKEAEVQGENLIKEAGDNALKQMAAKRAAKELKRQAEKQSTKLIQEAEKQADELIKQARAQAESI